MYFERLSDKEKKFVQKNLFNGTGNDNVAYSMIEKDGEVYADVMDFVNSTESNIFENVYVYNDFELIDIRTNVKCPNNFNVVENMIKHHKRLDISVFNYNYAMGLLNKEYQHEAEEYFKSKAMDRALSPIMQNAYSKHYSKLKEAYNRMNAGHLNNENEETKEPIDELSL